MYYLDECGIEHGLYREQARAPRGQKIPAQVSGKLRKRTNVIGTCQSGKLVASMVFEGACNAAVVEAYFEKVLLPVLPEGSVVVLDNARFHHGSAAAELSAAKGIRLKYLPPYSPDLNPIEHFWAKFKRLLRPQLPSSNNPFLTIINLCQCC